VIEKETSPSLGFYLLHGCCCFFIEEEKEEKCCIY
jgi:hypothetical protein